MVIALSISDWILENLGLVLGWGIVVIGLAVGSRDLARLNFKRIWAISSVGFRESIRRRVLWVTPLAMLGIVAVSQLSHPSDEQDAIRQTTKYCLFASGIVVVVATLILACTSLPKEIENRVIYTIVTKPTTRLEIVLGKTIGFARTSAAILLIMGLFSYIYLQINAAQLNSAIRARLATLPQSDQGRDTLEHYLDEGLLQARAYVRPEAGAWGIAPGFQIYAKPPVAADRYKWIFGNQEQNVIFPFEISDEILKHSEAHLIFNVQVATQQPRPLNRREMENEAPDPTATTRPTAPGAQKRPGPAAISATVLNENAFAVIPPAQLMDRIHSTDSKNRDPEEFHNANALVLEPAGADGAKRAVIVAMSKGIQERIATLDPTPEGKRRIYLMINGMSPATLYGFAPDSVTLTAQVLDTSGKEINLPIPRPELDGKPAPPVFRGRLSSNRNQQLRGDSDPAEAPVGIFEFREKGLTAASDYVPFELRSKVERSGAEASEAENPSRVEIQIINRTSGFTSQPIMIAVDSDRPTFFRVPKAAVEGGIFDLLVRSRTEGHFVGLRTGSVAVASFAQSFAFNLVKSLVILWLLSVLVVIISVFCSTFVSWPIAVVLALVLLLGRWCVVQLGDTNSPQQMATDIFGANANPVTTRVFTDTVSALNKLLAVAAKVLPDLDQFRVTEDIERGVSISYRSLLDPLMVIVTFGGPILILAYLFLRKKEVAP